MGVAGTCVSPAAASDTASLGQAGRQAERDFRRCAIGRLPEPKRRDLAAFPTLYSQQTLFKEGQTPDGLLAGQLAPSLRAAVPLPEHTAPSANSAPAPPSCWRCGSRPHRSRAGCRPTTVHGSQPGGAIRRCSLASAQLPRLGRRPRAGQPWHHIHAPAFPGSSDSSCPFTCRGMLPRLVALEPKGSVPHRSPCCHLNSGTAFPCMKGDFSPARFPPPNDARCYGHLHHRSQQLSTRRWGQTTHASPWAAPKAFTSPSAPNTVTHWWCFPTSG